MKTISTTTLLFLIPLLLSARDGVRTDTIAVPHMQCGMCEVTISKRLKKVEGVSGVEADAEANLVIVTYDPSKTSRTKLEKAIARAGYDAGSAKTTKKAQAKLHGCCRPSEG